MYISAMTGCFTVIFGKSAL